MSQQKMQMPSGMGGLVRYFDEYKSKFEFKPGHIVVLIIAVLILMAILYAFGAAMFGL